MPEKKIKTLLINPPISVNKSSGQWATAAVQLGLGYIAAFLEQYGYEVNILDAQALGINNIEENKDFIRIGLSKNEIKSNIERYQPDIVGISTMFTAYASDAHDVAKLVKEVNPEIHVNFGGAHSSAFPDAVLADRNVDSVVVGEGEISFLGLVRSLEKKESISKVEGTVVRKDNKIVYNPKQEFISDLDSIPFPSRHLLPMDIYLKYSNKAAKHFSMRQPAAVMITSRGCPKNCVYCSIHSIWGNKWRYRSALNVVDEIEFLVSEYGIREILFLDDNISANRTRMMNICDEIIKRKLDIRWTAPNGIAIWSLDKTLIRKMKESGCYRLTFGIESGDTETQKFIRKNLDLNHAKEIIKFTNNIGIWTICTFIMGFPHENLKAIKNTMDFATNSDIDFALFYLLEPFPGTQIYEIFKNEGLMNNIKDQDLKNLISSGNCGCDTRFFSKEELQSLQAMAYSRFSSRNIFSYLTSMRIPRKINSLEDLQYLFKLIKSWVALKSNQLRYGGSINAKTLYGDRRKE